MSNYGSAASAAAEHPRNVTRGWKTQLGFLGLDSLYLVMEYPHDDVYRNWASAVSGMSDKEINNGVPQDGCVIRKAGNGYTLAVWDEDARLFITDHVNDNLRKTKQAGQGMGIQLQLGPKWLRKYGDIIWLKSFKESVIAQFAVFGVRDPERYRIRLNRVDITVDLIGVNLAAYLMDMWRTDWVGRARKRRIFDSDMSGVETVRIGTNSATVSFKAYNKIKESLAKGTTGFWQSVWGLSSLDDVDVTRFEWTIKAYEGKFKGMRYLDECTVEGFMQLLNYATTQWGRLCIPEPTEHNKQRWELAPLWKELRSHIEDWCCNYDQVAERIYDYEPDLKPQFLRSFAGYLSTLRARIGSHRALGRPATIEEVLEYLEKWGYLAHADDDAIHKWQIQMLSSGKGYAGA